MENDKNKYLVISITELHQDLLDAIKLNAKKEKATVSHYVRSLLYKAIIGNEQKDTATMDVSGAAGAMGKGIRESR